MGTFLGKRAVTSPNNRNMKATSPTGPAHPVYGATCISRFAMVQGIVFLRSDGVWRWYGDPRVHEIHLAKVCLIDFFKHKQSILWSYIFQQRLWRFIVNFACSQLADYFDAQFDWMGKEVSKCIFFIESVWRSFNWQLDKQMANNFHQSVSILSGSPLADMREKACWERSFSMFDLCCGT